MMTDSYLCSRINRRERKERLFALPLRKNRKDKRRDRVQSNNYSIYRVVEGKGAKQRDSKSKGAKQCQTHNEWAKQRETQREKSEAMNLLRCRGEWVKQRKKETVKKKTREAMRHTISSLAKQTKEKTQRDRTEGSFIVIVRERRWGSSFNSKGEGVSSSTRLERKDRTEDALTHSYLGQSG